MGSVDRFNLTKCTSCLCNNETVIDCEADGMLCNEHNCPLCILQMRVRLFVGEQLPLNAYLIHIVPFEFLLTSNNVSVAYRHRAYLFLSFQS